MARDLELELRKLGFEEREAKVYLAALELGPSPVQKIAQRANIPRATTYLVLDDLQNKGFVTTYDEGKKTLFVAESPERLAIIIDQREVEVKQQREAVNKLVPELTARGQFEHGERPVVRYYEGEQAVKALLKDSLGGRGGEVLNIFHLDHAIRTLEQIGFPIDKVRERRSKRHIKSRVIYTSKNGPLEDYSTKHRQAKYVPVEKYPFAADIIIRSENNRVFFIPYTSPLHGVAIEDKAIANSIKMIFEILWASLR